MSLPRPRVGQGGCRGSCDSLRRVLSWETSASLATAGGTLVLAMATFASVRSANRSARSADRAARVAERALMAGMRPLLVNSRMQDSEQKIAFVEGNWHRVPGGRAVMQVTDEVVYMAISVRNVGTGLAVMHGWHVNEGFTSERVHPELDDFTSQQRDIYVAPGDIGFWQGALRDPAAAAFDTVSTAVTKMQPVILYLLYGDYEGGQRVITQFAIRPAGENWIAAAVRHFNVDRPDPR
jgi:hypothetical protein